MFRRRRFKRRFHRRFGRKGFRKKGFRRGRFKRRSLRSNRLGVRATGGMFISRLGNLNNNPVVLTLPATATGAAVTTEFNRSFKLNDLEIGDLEQIFDQYRILGVAVKFIPLFTVPTGTVEVATVPPTVLPYPVPYIYITYDPDNTTTSALPDFAQRRTKNMRADRVLSFYIKRPKINIPVQSVADTETIRVGVSSANRWLDMAEPGIPHFGLRIRFYVQDWNGVPSVPGLTYKWRFITRYYIRLRTQR